jgi:hypothetical protein
MLQNVGINITCPTVREGVWFTEHATNITPHAGGKMTAAVISTPEGKAYFQLLPVP